MLPKKIANLSFDEFKNICENPSAYNLTIQEMFDIAEAGKKLTDAYYSDENEKLKNKLDMALKENARLRSIVESAHMKIDYTENLNGDS